MPDKALLLHSEIDKTASKVSLGAGHRQTNKIVIRLVNTGNEAVEFGGFGEQGTLELAISIGTQARDLVAGSEVSSLITIQRPEDWLLSSYKQLDGKGMWSLELPEKVFERNAETRLTLTNFECNTDPGSAQLTVRVSITGYNKYETTLDVEKQAADVLQILYFKGIPPQIITPGDRNAFTIEWNTLKAGQATLYKADTRLKTFQEERDGFKNGEKFQYKEEKPSLTTVYKLVATDKADPSNSQEATFTLQVLPSGWHRVDDFRGRLGYPAMLCNVNGVKLYSIFIKHGKAAVCSAEYPVAVWDLLHDRVPENMATSPAVYFGQRLWLIGGSTADPRMCSNQVWSYEPARGEWSQHKTPAWTPRMGHACVVFQNRLWVLGGLDANGNARNEVWSWDAKGTWERHSPAGWSGRCMHAAAVFHDRIWIYGGVPEPFGDPREDMWTSRDGQTWEPFETIPRDRGNPIGKALGCTLQPIKGQLHLFGSFRRGTIVQSKQFTLEEAQETWHASDIPSEKSWHPQGDNTFSLLSTEYKGLVFLRSLNYQTADNPTSLQVYLP